jgi:competence protein ComFB
MEIVVANLIHEIISEIKMCTCNKCFMDITALALNDLKPKYFTTYEGEVQMRVNLLREQNEVDIITAITKAAILVKRNPRDMKYKDHVEKD